MKKSKLFKLLAVAAVGLFGASLYCARKEKRKEEIREDMDELDYILTSLPKDKKELEGLFKEREDEVARMGDDKFKDSCFEDYFNEEAGMIQLDVNAKLGRLEKLSEKYPSYKDDVKTQTKNFEGLL